MAAFTNVEEGKRAAIHLLTFEASTGYILPNDKKLYYNATKAMQTLKKLCSEACLRGATWYEGEIVELFRDKDSGQYLPAVGNPSIKMPYGKRPA